MNISEAVKRADDECRQRDQYELWLMRHGKHWLDPRQQTFDACFEADWNEATAA